MMYTSTRYATGGFVGITVSLALQYAMQGLIAQAKGLGEGVTRVQLLPFVHVQPDESVETETEQFAPPPKPSPLPPSPTPTDDPLQKSVIKFALPPPSESRIESRPQRFPALTAIHSAWSVPLRSTRRGRWSAAWRGTASWITPSRL